MIDAEQIKRARRSLKESQADFAKRFGVDQSTVSRWETEGVPDRGPWQILVKHVLRETREQARAS